MIFSSIEQLKGLNDITIRSGLADGQGTEFEAKYAFSLPKAHLDALQFSNGIEVYAGFVRLFGLYTTDCIDSVEWNTTQHWKFAWEDRCKDYWCFAETAWGDQYAYSISSLIEERDDKVFFLDALSMTPRPIFVSFAEFFAKEFLRQAKNPYDVMLRQARSKFESLKPNLHLIHVPSILLGGLDDISFVQTQNARSAMICNGDIATQIDAAEVGSSVVAVQPYEDELHRIRLRLAWA